MIFHLDRTDSSGIRFYLGNKLRQYDLGYLTFGTDSSAVALAIPPKAERFIIDAYCTANATQVKQDCFSCSSLSNEFIINNYYCSIFLKTVSQLSPRFRIHIYKVYLNFKNKISEFLSNVNAFLS